MSTDHCGFGVSVFSFKAKCPQCIIDLYFQVLSTVLLNIIPEGKSPLNMTGNSKLNEKVNYTSVGTERVLLFYRYFHLWDTCQSLSLKMFSKTISELSEQKTERVGGLQEIALAKENG